MANPTKFTWVVPTTNTDGSAITAGELTGYDIGVRPASGTAGTYPIMTTVADPAATQEPIASLSAVLAPGDYAAAIRSDAATNSVWSSEVTFSITAPVPNPPSAFTVA